MVWLWAAFVGFVRLFTRRERVARDVGQIERGLRVIALVRDADDAVLEPEREQQLGRVRDEADDAHDRIVDVGDAQASWSDDGTALVRELTFADFAAAIAFVDRVAQAAEAAGHHPDILVHGWNRVRLSLFTHSAGQVTDADHALARAIDDLVDA